MNPSPRIRMKILAYSKLFKAIGVIDEELYNEVTSSLKGRVKGK